MVGVDGEAPGDARPGARTVELDLPVAGLCSAPRGRDPAELEESLLSDLAPDQNAVTGRRPWLLLVGAAIGLALAAFGLLETRSDPARLSADTAARVGDRMLRRIDYERILAGVERDRRGPIDDSMRRRVLDRMIDEELLVQRALELGLAVIDRRVRGELTSALMDSIVGEADADPANDHEVREHFEENIDFFSGPGRLHAKAIFFSPRGGDRRQDGSAAERAGRAIRELRAGGSPSEIENRLGDPQVSPLPDGMLPPNKIRDYVGPVILRTLEGLAVGAWSDPIESASGVYLAGLVDREPRIVPNFEEVADLARQDLKRRRGDEALRRYLDDLRSRTSVAINESVFSVGQ